MLVYLAVGQVLCVALCIDNKRRGLGFGYDSDMLPFVWVALTAAWPVVCAWAVWEWRGEMVYRRALRAMTGEG